jgi:hypothetical protein
MAEVIGVVAAGIGIMPTVVELGASIVKLRELYQEFKNAPSDLLELVQEIEGMSALL